MEREKERLHRHIRTKEKSMQNQEEYEARVKDEMRRKEMKVKKIEDKMRREMKEHKKKLEILEYKRELKRK